VERQTALSDGEIAIIVECAERYGVSSVYLFGSSIQGMGQPRDIDLGVDGLPPNLFFKFYGDLIKRLPRQVDVVDLSKPFLFQRLIVETGLKLYERPGAED
jgi:predicted nucleotidyltransferase